MALTAQDQVELLQLLGLYTHALDYGQVETMDQVWTEDCIFQVDNPAMRFDGLPALQEMFRGSKAGYPQVRHVVSNQYIEAGASATKATLHSYLQIFDVSQLKVTMFARYRDLSVKTPQGWRISERWCING